jgi:hypothetical protein
MLVAKVENHRMLACMPISLWAVLERADGSWRVLEARLVLFEFRDERIEVFEACFGSVHAGRVVLTISNVNLPIDPVQLAEPANDVGGVVLNDNVGDVDAPGVAAEMGEFQRVSDVSCQITVSEPARRASEYGYPRNSVVVDSVTDRAQLAQRRDRSTCRLWSFSETSTVVFGAAAVRVDPAVTPTNGGTV